MTYEQILYEVRDRVALVTLNRPDKLNAWTTRMDEELRHAMHAADSDENARVIVLTGAGRGFCAGADMQLLGEAAAQRGANVARPAAQSAAGGTGVHPDFQKLKCYFPSLTKPVIAAVNGPVAGLGFVMMLFCDLRIASSEARFGTAFAKRGLIAEYGAAWLLPRIVGLANALDLLLSARMVDANEAFRIGLVNRVIPQEQFMDGVMQAAGELANTVSPRSLRVIKRQVYNAQLQTFGEAMDVAEQEMYQSLTCDDFREGVAHFVEKRAPAFTGR